METTVTTVTTTPIEDTFSTTTTILTVGSSSIDNTDNLYDGIECTNMFLALIVLLLILGWLYDYFKGLFDNV